MKQTIDTDGSQTINAKENYVRGWLSMEQPTNHDGCSPEKNAIDGRTLVDYPCRKWTVMTNAI